MKISERDLLKFNGSKRTIYRMSGQDIIIFEVTELEGRMEKNSDTFKEVFELFEFFFHFLAKLVSEKFIFFFINKSFFFLRFLSQNIEHF